MKTSIATVSLSGDLGSKVAAIAAAGYDGFELFESDLTFSDIRPLDFRRRYEDRGLRLFAFQPFRDFEGLLDAKRSAAFDRAEAKFDLMETLGTDLLCVPSSVSPFAADGLDRYAADFRELGDRAAQRGFRVAYEALAWGRHVRDWMQAWDVVTRADHPHVGLVLDTYHLFVRGNPIAGIRNLPADKIFLVQLADAPSLDMEVLRHSRHLRNFPGQGDYPIVEFMVELLATGYDDVISHEIFNDDFRVAPAEQTAIDGYRSLIWLEEQVTKKLQAKPVPVSARPKWTPRNDVSYESTLGGVAFVEFGVASPLEASSLETFLESIGFPKTHHHRTKRVSLHSRGGTYFAVNSEPESYARRFAQGRGTAACAIGFETSDADRAMERALGFCAVEVLGDRHPGQIRLPAIAGVGGALVYFVDMRAKHFTETDFDAVVEVSAGVERDSMLSNGSLRIDHIAQAVAPHELLSVLLFYRAALGFSLQPPLELVDPNGLVTSRTVISPNGAIRIPLNSATAAATSPETFRSAAHGSGVQHIAIATDSIASVVDFIDPTVVLSIPENYYDDLDARFGIDEPTLEFLREHNVLYDRTDDGEFFHLYTREVHGVFFEFVQRNNYSGFGAANAPVRLAAQSRTRRPQTQAEAADVRS